MRLVGTMEAYDHTRAGISSGKIMPSREKTGHCFQPWNWGEKSEIKNRA
jgi:hypothetical protein